MTYNELLEQESWYEKCVEILHRDRYRCQKCGALGYHNNAFYECQTADELDSFLKGMLIKGDKPSAFLDRIKEDANLKGFFINSGKGLTDMQCIGDKYLSDLTISVDKIGRISRKALIVSKNKILDKKCRGSFIYEKDVVVPQDTNFVFSSGSLGRPNLDNYEPEAGICLFLGSSYFDNYIVRIERRWPAGANGDDHGVVLWGSVFMSICYQDCCITLEFLDETSFDNDGNRLKEPIVPKSLNIHHKFYIDGKKPWEYDNDVLVTLCEDCHCDTHTSAKTPVYKELYGRQILRYAEICDRCAGRGYLPQYRHVEGGICFKCRGEGVIADPKDIERFMQKYWKTSTNS